MKKRNLDKVIFLRVSEVLYNDLIKEAGDKRNLPKVVRNKLVNSSDNNSIVLI